MGGASIEGLNNRGLYEMGRPREIGVADTKYAVERAFHVHMPADRMILQMSPQDFVVDGRAEYWNPQGAQGSRLESFVHLVTTSTQEHQCLVGAVHQAHLAVEETVFEPFAAAYATVEAEERAEGVAIVDIGAHSTDMVIYYGDALLAAASLPICGDHFTRDVAQGLCISFEDAEKLKLECGCAMVGLTADNSIIELPSPEGRPPREAPRLELNRILEARAEELFLYVRQEFVQGRVGAGAAERRGADRRRGAHDRPVRHGRARAELPGAQRSGRRHPGLARGVGRPRLDHGGGTGDVRGPPQAARRRR